MNKNEANRLLLNASRDNNLELVKRALDNGADVNYVRPGDRHMEPVWFIAFKLQRYKVVHYFLTNCDNMEITEGQINNLHYNYKSTHENALENECFKLLYEYNTTSRIRQLEKALRWYVKNDDASGDEDDYYVKGLRKAEKLLGISREELN